MTQKILYDVSPKVKAVYTRLMENPGVQQGLTFLRADHGNAISEQKQICEIPAPPFKEKARAEDYMRRLTASGLRNVQMDQEGNAFGTWTGRGDGPKLVVAAHLDTVFPEGTDVKVREREERLYAPGVSDDARGLAVLLTVVRAFAQGGIYPAGEVIFCGDVGEEGLGDLRGIKALFRNHPDIDGFIAIDGVDAHGIRYEATGSRRYEITYHGPGGHSFAAFGLPSAIHALGRAISEIADLQTPKDPKTTFSVGTVKGGTSVNSIAAEASLLMDMRSNARKELFELEERFLEIVNKAAAAENFRWGSDQIRIAKNVVGDRPAGSQPRDAIIVQAAWAATEALGLKPFFKEPGSTDANLPISLGIPALTLGGGGADSGNHSLNEWFDPAGAFVGPQRIFLTILGLLGREGISQPLLPKRN